MDTVEFLQLRDKVSNLLKQEADALALAAELIRSGNLSQPPWICELLRNADLSRAERTVLIDRLREVDPFATRRE